MKTHPAAELFPLIDGPSFDALVADVGANGLVHPIVTLDGKVLDGRNRLRACYAATVKPIFSKYEGSDPFGYVVSANLSRRHLDASQRAMVAARLKEARANFAASEEKTSKSANLRSGKSVAPVATAMNVSARSVESAAKVLEHGAAVTIQAVDAGELAVSRAAQISTLPKMEQRAAVKEALADKPDEPGYSVEDQQAEYAADFAAMVRIIDADDKLAAAVSEVRVVRKQLATVTALYDDKSREVATITKEAARWMRKAKKAAACQNCMTALERE